MKDELRVYCKLEGMNEEYLRALVKAERKSARLEKKRAKKDGALSLKKEPEGA